MLQTNYTTVTNLRMELLFNQPEQVDNGDGTFTTKYRPLTIKLYAQAITSDGGKKDVQYTTTMGSLQTSEMTAKQLYTAAGNASTLNTTIQTAMKQLYLAATADDISV